MANLFDGVDGPTVQAILALQLQDAEELFEVAADGTIGDTACAAALLLADIKLEQAITTAVSDAPAADAGAILEPLVERVHQPPHIYRECAVCRDPVAEGDLLWAPCQHYYCADCLEQLVSQSMVDETLYPPRCCQRPMPRERFGDFLTAELVQRFEAKREELDSKNRTYCHQPTCSKFIGADGITGDRATCHRCQQDTCTVCKKAWHIGDCPDDQDLQRTLEMATEQGWQRCQACRRMVELNTGCNHITCLCSAEFCYVCGVTWKSCECPQWDEDHLVARAENIANRNANRGGYRPPYQRGRGDLGRGRGSRAPRGGGRGGAAARPADRAAVEAVAADLRANHDCDHDDWSRVRDGPHQCEVCHDTLPDYIFNCDQCQLQACFRCRANRL